MKKTLIALAALASSAAFAQSSVTLYGVADAGFGKVTDQSGKLVSGDTLNNGTSRWGVRGTEDLGGGLKAGFNFEQGLNLTDGSISKAGGGEFGRAAWVNLSGGFGDIRLGRSLTAAFYGVSAWELTGTANYSVVGNQFGYAAASARYSSQILYTSPSFSGFSFAIGHVLKGNNEDNSITALNAIYKNGPLVASLAYSKAKSEEDGHKAIGARYSFGSFTLGGGIFDPEGDSKGFSLGGSVNAGPVILTLDVARDTEYKDTDVLFEAKYPLSKRTFTYLSVLRDGNKKAGGLARAAQAAGTAAGENVTGVGLGIRHNF